MDTLLNHLGRGILGKVADMAAMINPPETEAEYIMSIAPQGDALFVAEQCLDIMAETECEEIINYWRKVCAHIRLCSVKH